MNWSLFFEIGDGQIYESLTEDVSGHYISWKCGNYGYYEDGTPLPKGYRIVHRYLKGVLLSLPKHLYIMISTEHMMLDIVK